MCYAFKEMKRLYIVYVPGLGDENITLQARALNLWRWFGVKPEVVQMHWANAEPWPDKLQRLLATIDAIRGQGGNVALVGVSAGASAVINAFAMRQHDVVGCVLIAGKVNRPEAIGDYYRQHNPRFVDAAYAAPDALQQLAPEARARIQSRYALRDGVVGRADSHIAGAHNKTLPTIGHVFTITTQLTFGAPAIIRFLKRQATAGTK